jgi:hypothetical protein
MRGKAIGFADRPVVLMVPRLREPWTGCLDLAGRAVQDSRCMRAGRPTKSGLIGPIPSNAIANATSVADKLSGLFPASPARIG